MISKAAAHFKNGDLVVFPTDTVYGVGCIISNEGAIKKLHRIRRDPVNKPTLILVSSFEQAFEYGVFTKSAKTLVEEFWPGPLTIVIGAKRIVPKMIRGTASTIAIRLPDQPPILKMIEKVGEPILAPSANFHYNSAPVNFDQIDKKLLALVDYAIDLATLKGSRPMIGKPSTLVDLTVKPYISTEKQAARCNRDDYISRRNNRRDVIEDDYKIIRPGCVSEEKIKKALGGADG